jgi:hypothetical protein
MRSPSEIPLDVWVFVGPQPEAELFSRTQTVPGSVSRGALLRSRQLESAPWWFAQVLEKDLRQGTGRARDYCALLVPNFGERQLRDYPVVRFQAAYLQS